MGILQSELLQTRLSWSVPSRTVEGRVYTVSLHHDGWHSCNCSIRPLGRECAHIKEIKDGQWLPNNVAAFSKRVNQYIRYSSEVEAVTLMENGEILVPWCMDNPHVQLTAIYDLDKLGFPWRSLCDIFPLANSLKWRSEMLRAIQRCGRKKARLLQATLPPFLGSGASQA